MSSKNKVSTKWFLLKFQTHNKPRRLYWASLQAGGSPARRECRDITQEEFEQLLRENYGATEIERVPGVLTQAEYVKFVSDLTDKWMREKGYK